MPRRNLLTAPSFEIAANVSAGWSRSAASGGTADAIAREINAAYGARSGSYYGYTRRTTAGRLDVYHDEVPVTAGLSYAAQVQVNRDGSGAVGLDIDWYTASDTYISSSSSANITPASATWATLTAVGVAPANAAFAQVYIRFLAQGANQYVRWDAAMLEQAAAPGSYADGTTVGWGWEGVAHASSSRESTRNECPSPDAVTGWGGGGTAGTPASSFVQNVSTSGLMDGATAAILTQSGLSGNARVTAAKETSPVDADGQWWSGTIQGWPEPPAQRCNNPVCATDATNWATGTGTGARVTGLTGMVSTTGYRATKTGSAGILNAYADRAAVTPGETVTGTLQVRPSFATDVIWYMIFRNSSGAEIGSALVTGPRINGIAANGTAVSRVTATVPTGAAFAEIAVATSTSGAVGSTLTVTGHRFDAGSDAAMEYARTLSCAAELVFRNASGTQLAATVNAPSVSAPTGMPVRVWAQGQAPAGTRSVEVTFLARAAGAKTKVWATAARLDQINDTALPFRDGDSAGWAWDGAPGVTPSGVSDTLWRADTDSSSAATVGTSIGYFGTQYQVGTGSIQNNYTAVPVEAAPGGRPGRATRITIPDGVQRYEHKPDHREFDIGDPPFFFGVAFYLAADFPLDANDFQVVEQIHQAWGSWSPPVAFEARQGALYLTGGNGLPNGSSNPTQYAHSQRLATIDRERWLSLIYQIENWSDQVNTSRITVWLDGVKVLDRWVIPCPTIVQGDAATRTSYRKQGFYHRPTLPGGTIWHAGAALGTSYASVDPYRAPTYQTWAGAAAAVSGTVATAAATHIPSGSAAAVSGTRAAAAPRLDAAGAAASLSGTRAAAAPITIGAGGADAVSATRAAVAMPAATGYPGLLPAITGTRAAVAPSVMAAAVAVSGTRGDAAPIALGAGAAAAVSGTLVLGGASVNPPLLATATSGTRAAVGAGLDAAAAAAAVTATRAAADAVRAAFADAVAVTATRAVAAGTLGQPGQATSLSGSRGETAAALEAAAAARAVSGTVAGAVPLGVNVAVSGTRGEAGPRLLAAAVAVAVTGSRALVGVPAVTTAGAAVAVSGTRGDVVAGVVARFAAAAAVSGSRALVGAPTVVKIGAAVAVAGTRAGAAARIGVPGAGYVVTGTVVIALGGTPFRPRFRIPDGPVKPQAPVPRTRLQIADTVTGRLHFELPYTALTWNSPLNDIGQAQATLPIEETLESVYAQGARDPRSALREILLGPYRWSPVVTVGDAAVWGGPYVPSQDSGGGTITIGARGMERMLERRVLVDTNPTRTTPLSAPDRDFVFPQTTPGHAIWRLMLAATETHQGQVPSRALPIWCSWVPPALGEETFTYLAYDMVSVWKAISDIAARDDGPDVRLEPQLYQGADGTYVRWDLQIGDPFLPASGNPGPEGPLPWTFDDTTSVITRTVDAVGMATSWWASGDGQDRDKKIVRAATDNLTALGFPTLEHVDTSSTSQTDLLKLESSTRAALAAHQTPTDSWQLAAPVDGAPPVGAVRRGDLARIDVTRQLLIEPGYYPRRITNVSGDASSGRFTMACEEMETVLTETDPIPPSTGKPEPYVPPYRPPATSVKVKDLTGSTVTGRYGVGGTDLGIPIVAPDGRLVMVFGDTFEAGVGSAGWRSPVALFADPGSVGTGLTWTGAAGAGDYAAQIAAYTHDAVLRGEQVSTVLPTDLFRVGDTLYLHVMACNGLGNVRFTELLSSTDNGETWAWTGVTWPGTVFGGLFQLPTFASSGGYVYAFSTGFQRDKGLILLRVLEGSVATPSAWQVWTGGDTWSATGTPTIALPGGFGEMSLRAIAGRWVLAGFDAAAYRIDVRVFAAGASLRDVASARVFTAVRGAAWGQEDHARGAVAQLYGGYILPGSTLTALHLAVSQWKTDDNSVYKAMQFRADVSSAAT